MKKFFSLFALLPIIGLNSGNIELKQLSTLETMDLTEWQHLGRLGDEYANAPYANMDFKVDVYYYNSADADYYSFIFDINLIPGKSLNQDRYDQWDSDNFLISGGVPTSAFCEFQYCNVESSGPANTPTSDKNKQQVDIGFADKPISYDFTMSHNLVDSYYVSKEKQKHTLEWAINDNYAGAEVSTNLKPGFTIKDTEKWGLIDFDINLQYQLDHFWSSPRRAFDEHPRVTIKRGAISCSYPSTPSRATCGSRT